MAAPYQTKDEYYQKENYLALIRYFLPPFPGWGVHMNMMNSGVMPETKPAKRTKRSREDIFKHLVKIRPDIQALNQRTATYLHDMLVMELLSPLSNDEKLAFLDAVDS